MSEQVLTTPKGTKYYSFDEVVIDDPIRAFVPARLPKEVVVIWAIHGFGSSHDALLGGYHYLGEQAVDRGYVIVCPNLGGSLWSSPKAQRLLKAAYSALERRLNARGAVITHQVMVGTSHGGCLATYAAGKRLIPNIGGLYLINGVYDATSRRGSYGSGMGLHYRLSGGTDATNPANLPIVNFAGLEIGITYDPADPTVNATDNGAKFAQRLFDAAGTVPSVMVHKSGHSTPSGAVGAIMGLVSRVTA